MITRTISLIRKVTGPNGTFGEVRTDSGYKYCSLEREKIGDHPCIPVGAYLCEVKNHPIHGMVYEVANVPGRTAILIHPANFVDQLLGCIALGKQIEAMKDIAHSQMAVKEFMSVLQNQPITLVISEAF